MPQIGPFNVEGPQSQVDLVKKALNRLDADVDMNHFIRQEFLVVFGPVDNIQGTNKPAFGFFHGSQRRLNIRHNMPNARNLRPLEVQYTFLHESFGHGGELDHVLNRAMRSEILVGMGVPMGGPSFIDVKTSWRRGDDIGPGPVDYWARPFEAYADMLVSSISDLPAMFAPRYIWDIEPALLKEIVLRTAEDDPVPDPVEEPEPLPDPKDDPCLKLRAQVAALQADIELLKAGGLG